jgi:hypothetical protein
MFRKLVLIPFSSVVGEKAPIPLGPVERTSLNFMHEDC